MPDYLSRRNKLRKLFEDYAQASVFFDQVSIRYLTGFSGSNAALFVSQDEKSDLLLTDSRYTKRAEIEATDIEARIDRNFIKNIKSGSTATLYGITAA